MKIILILTLSLSIFATACGDGDNANCQEATDEFAACDSFKVEPDAVNRCKTSPKKDAIIDCSNAGDCETMIGCLVTIK